MQDAPVGPGFRRLARHHYLGAVTAVGEPRCHEITVPSQHYLSSAIVEQKTNEIPVARELFKNLNWTRAKSAWTLCTPKPRPRERALKHGADYLLTGKPISPRCE